MKGEQDGLPKFPARKMKFTPKIPPRKAPKPLTTKTEKPETKDDVVDKELLSKLNHAKANNGLMRRFPKSDRKVGPSEVAFGHGSSSLARSFPKGRGTGIQDSDGLDVQKFEKEYVEPWDYDHSYYPSTLPLRRPYSGNPEILDEEEFGEASASLGMDETKIDSAGELGLMEKREETQMLFFQFPANLPLPKQPAASTNTKDAAGKIDRALKKGCKLEELQPGFMGKLLVYKSGKVKMKLGDTLFDVSPGLCGSFAQDVVAINTKDKRCCVLGEIDRRAVVTPDIDALLDSINDLD
ncbi:uncharacterized protein LOC135626849 [Musa acuminata AAA Group]|uniref:uncharacterized protein LOC135626849 n=1 Tax=Musa acuminata AAA Group TaxID=214697 RepID=UPI0031DA5E8C